MSEFGHFNSSGDEYIVTRFDTPLPWVNYLTNGDYCAIFSSTGGGFSFFQSHHAHTVLRREQRNLLNDRPGRYVYIRDNDTGDYWTLNILPVKAAHQRFRCVHGLGYSRIESQTNGIEGTMIAYVPCGHNAEILDIALTNRDVRRRNLSIFFYEELQLGNFEFQEHERSIASMFGSVRCHEGVLTAQYRLWSTRREPGATFQAASEWPLEVFIFSTTPPRAFETSQEAFVGVHRDVHDPQAMLQERLSNGENEGRPAIAAFQWDVLLEPDETFVTQVATGVAPREAGQSVCSALRSALESGLLLAETKAFWKQAMGEISVETPDTALNQHFQYWNKYQLYINFHFGRAPSYYHLEQGMGMRDSFQDAFGMIPLNPQAARAQILRVAGFLFSDGSPCDVTSRIEYQAHKGIKVDVPVWMALAVCDYIKESGDWNVLDEDLPYLDGGSGSLYEHMLRGVLRILKEPGLHGLPLFGGGDWNDSLNRVGVGGRGESVWLAQFLYFAIGEIEPLLKRKGDRDTWDRLQGFANTLRANHEAHGWDGQWYRIGFNDVHEPVGTSHDRVGRVYLNTQTWAILSGIASSERQELAMDAVDHHLETAFGLALVSPAYDRLDPGIGVSSAFAPGLKENGAVFSHATAFNLAAKAKLGRGNDLYRVYLKALPRLRDPRVAKVEPYVYSQFCDGPDSPDHGRGAYHWMTGTAAWMFRAVLDSMVGLRADYEALVVDPCIPAAWGTFQATRSFRGSVYNVRFSNPDHVQTGVLWVSLDGVRIAGNRIPIPSTTGSHEVEVLMGRPM